MNYENEKSHDYCNCLTNPGWSHEDVDSMLSSLMKEIDRAGIRTVACDLDQETGMADLTPIVVPA